MDFRILGPLEVYAGDRPLALGGVKQRTLLALLLLNVNEVVSSDRLIEDLWDREGPENTSKALQVAVSRLRRALEPDRGSGQTSALLVTRAPGYELRLKRGELDLHRFEDELAAGRRALAAGDAVVAAATLKRALALWRGPPLVDLAHESVPGAEIARLEELRTTAVEARIGADLELGHHAAVVAELVELVDRHPLRERLREQLMLALYRCGRQAEALDAYADARRVLTEELGLEPGRELQDLQRAVLRQDPALDRRPVAAVRSAARSTFVARERELAGMAGALDDALAGRGRLVLVVGEPGIGKSRLADELLGRARAHGARVIVGRCWEAGGAPAYWPWIQSLSAYVSDTDPGELRVQLGAGAADLAQLLPQLRELFDDIAQPPALDSEGVRFRLFEAVGALLRRAAQARPLVLMLDDLHAADEPSLLLLRFVARELPGSRLLVICALRDVDPTPSEPIESTLAELVREPHSMQLALAGLREADIARYIELATGVAPATGLTQAIHAETEGNPLFVAELVRLLDTDGRIADAEVHLRIPAGVRAVIGQRVRRLSARCRGVLEPACVMGREFGLEVLAHVSELSRHELLDALDEAIGERIVADVPGAPGRLRFGHALIRDTLYDELPAALRLTLHRAAAEAIEAVYATDLDPHLAELAHHYIAAAPGGLAGTAVTFARRAGDLARSQLAYEEAVRLYTRALELATDRTVRCELLLARADVQARAGDTPAARQTYLRAADLAEKLEQPDRLAAAALGYGGRMIWDVTRGDEAHVPLLERALAAVGTDDSPLRVRLLTRLTAGPLRDASFPPQRRHALSEEALAMARRIGDPATLAYTLAGYAAANHGPDFTPRQVDVATELIDAALQAGDLERAAEGYEHRASTLIELADTAAAKADVDVMAKLARDLRQPSHDWIVDVYRALLALLQGDLADAEVLMTRARAHGERAQSWNAAVTHGLQLYVLRREQGRLHEMEDLVRRAVVEYPTYPIWRCVLAQMTAQLGREREARDALDALASGGFASVPFDEEWLVSMCLLAQTAVTLDGADRARELYAMLVPYDDRIAISYPEIAVGAVAWYLAHLAAILGRRDDAERHFRDALEINTRAGARPWIARTRCDFAAMLVARGAPGDADRALRLGAPNVDS